MALSMRILLVLAVAVFAAAVTAQDVALLPDAMVTTLAKLAPDKLGLSKLLVAPVPSCTMTALIQPGDTFDSIMTAFNVDVRWMLTLNPGLRSKALTPQSSICIGGHGATCNSDLDAEGLCPDVSQPAPLVPANDTSITLSDDLRAAFTGQPDLYTIFTDAQTLSTVITVNNTITSLVMTVPGISPAITSVQDNPGHPFILLWANGGATTPLVITIIPNWFADSAGLITYMPGTLLLPNSVKMIGNRKLLYAGSYPAGTAYCQQSSYFG